MCLPNSQVRCSKGPDPSICSACARLGFRCSLTISTTPGSGTDTSPTAVPRKRGSRACDACRAQKSQCSGDSPSCSRCLRLEMPCIYSLSIRQYKAQQRRQSSVIAEDVSVRSEDVVSFSGSHRTEVESLDDPRRRSDIIQDQFNE
jgi:hypothetical protein